MLWPGFVLAVAVDALLLELLPVQGDDGPDLFAAVILAGFLNLFVVAVAAPLAGLALRRRRRGTPAVVATDQAGTVLLGAVAVLLAVLGLAHRPAVRAADADLANQATVAREFVLGHAPSQYQANVSRLSTWKQGPDLYRTCVPGSDPRRAFCMIIKTDRSPPSVVPDHDQRPNGTAAGTDGSARR